MDTEAMSLGHTPSCSTAGALGQSREQVQGCAGPTAINDKCMSFILLSNRQHHKDQEGVHVESQGAFLENLEPMEKLSWKSMVLGA